MQDVTDAKSTGIFVVHALHPRCIAQAVFTGNGVEIEVLEWWDPGAFDKRDAVLKRMRAWVISQV